MASLSYHRRCGCDCRDTAEFTPDTAVFNPLCCTACDGGVKPPCCYVMLFECAVYCPPLDSGNPVLIANPGQVLRPLCPWVKPCQFVAPAAANKFPSDFSNDWLDGCTWSQRNGFVGTGGSVAGFDYQRALSNVGWTLDIAVSPVTLSHVSGIVYQQDDAVAWQCFFSNTLKLQPGEPSCSSLPQFVCIQPCLTTSQPQPQCCQNCFGVDLPDMSAYGIPAQSLQFLPTGSGIRGSAGLQIGANCVYQSRVICNQSTNGIGQAYLYAQTPMNGGAPSQAWLEIDYFTGGTFAPDGTIANLAFPTSVVFYCPDFTCSGGQFNVWTNPNFLAPWGTLNVYSTVCVNSENDDYAACPPSTCVGQKSIPDSRRQLYASEFARCSCTDDWCEVLPGGVTLFVNAVTGLSTITQDSCPQNQGHGGFQKTTNTVVGMPSGPVREQCVTINGVTGSHTMCVRIYCQNGAWNMELYCDGTYFSTIGITISSQCPTKGNAPIPAIPGCDVIGGCIGFNQSPSCQPPACCNNSDETNCHITFTSTCSAINGLSVPMTHVASHSWSGNAPRIGGGGVVGVLLTCNSGEWTIALGGVGCGTATLQTASCTCLPVMSGTFPSTTLVLCAGGPCVNGDTVSAVLTL